jgi:peptidoglycan pentaglycine glycine transferase (the first glycine)
MQSFLNSLAWEQFQAAAGYPPLRHQGQLYTVRGKGNFKYLLGSRLLLSAEATLPTPPTGSHFMRFEPIDADSQRQLFQLATQRSYKIQPTLAVQPRQSTIVDLTQDEAALLAGMHQKHRYNIRLAEKKGVEITIHSKDLGSVFPKFWELLSNTAARQEFRTHSKDYYEQLITHLEPEKMVHLGFAHYQGKLVTTLMLITYQGTATYLHGGSSSDHKEVMAPYLLQWQAMRYAQHLGCTSYDFWGVHALRATTEEPWKPEDGHPSSGVTRLKLGFGGEVVEYPGTFDVIIDPFWYSAYKTLRALRSRKRAFS